MEKQVLAKVGNKEITNLDVESAIQSLDPYQAMHFNNEEGKKKVLEDLINQELFYVDAKENNLHNDETFKLEIKKIEENILKQYAINKVLSNITLTEEEVNEYYNANKASFNKPQSASAKHILVDSEDSASDLLNKINSNEITFEDAAMSHSSCPSKDAGGDLGNFSKGQMVPEFEEAVFSMEKDEVRGPVQTQFGYHLIKLNEITEGGESSLEEVRAEIEKSLMYKKQNDTYTNVINNLKEKYNDLITY